MKVFYLISSFLLISFFTNAQTFDESDFIGTWYGTATNTYEGTFDITLELFEDGTYIDYSGHLMPSIYPDTQTWEVEKETNRLHFKYLKTVYAGQRTYTHFFYNVVNYDSEMFELHYNFWNEPEPQPEIERIVLSKSPNTHVNNQEITNSNRKLIGVYDMLGNEVSPEVYEGLMLYRYDDGSVEKKIILK